MDNESYKLEADSLLTNPKVLKSIKRKIGNQVKIYSDTPMGLGRLIQGSNLKLMFRTFSRTVPVS